MIPRQAFGRTGHVSSRLIFGAAALGAVAQKEADRALNLALDAGVNHFDVANSYGDAEERMGPWLATHRDQLFLATKTQKRTKKEALAELDNSLRLLRTDHVDLWQMHILVDEANWTTAMGENGALEAFVEARERGKTRFLGVTGHGKTAPAMHLRSLKRFDFDSVLFPWNWPLSRDADYSTAAAALREECRRRNVAFQLIKVFLRRPWGDRTPNRATWYEPLESPADIAAVLGWAWSLEDSFVNSAGDVNLLPTIVEEASKQPPAPPAGAMAELAERRGMEDLF